jgi:ribosomal-protein-alanine N-acetyltransferase
MSESKFSPFPSLQTERLLLRQLIQQDCDAIFALRSNAEVNQYLGRKPAASLDDARSFIESISAGIQQNKLMYWAIMPTGDARLAGTIGLFNFSVVSQTAEIGFELLPEFQGRGIMQEAASAVIEYAALTIGLQSIEATTHPGNKASLALLQKLHFRQKRKTEEDLLLFEYNRPDPTTYHQP